MNFELIFSIAGLMTMSGWLALLFSPLMPRWSDMIAGLLIPAVLAVGYTVILIFFPTQNGGGFGSFADVKLLFTNSNAVMAGWIHFLAFDLVVGAWLCREARLQNIKFWIVLPCLPVTFLFGPAGFLLFTALREVKHKSVRKAA